MKSKKIIEHHRILEISKNLGKSLEILQQQKTTPNKTTTNNDANPDPHPEANPDSNPDANPDPNPDANQKYNNITKLQPKSINSNKKYNDTTPLSSNIARMLARA